MGNGMMNEQYHITGRAVGHRPARQKILSDLKESMQFILAPTPLHEAKKKDCLLQRRKSICDSLRDEPQSSPVSYSPVSEQ